ncbi:hypothetical protein [[Acholeplasma] multilocale]|uniref:hypothetical protein n=1 Tax=[Acholeplasma] multilocale TaxID=264638 RepID=UPI00047B2FE6|nr:hypothetical protein [[Acholeplasma] multilocale]
MSYKSKKMVQYELRSNKWVNDTLSPLTIAPFWKLADNLVPEEQRSRTAMMAKSFASSIMPKTYLFVATRDEVHVAVTSESRRLKNKVIQFDKIQEITLSQDIWLKSRIYVKIKISWYRTMFLETSDPTSAIHFKEYVDRKKVENKNK